MQSVFTVTEVYLTRPLFFGPPAPGFPRMEDATNFKQMPKGKIMIADRKPHLI